MTNDSGQTVTNGRIEEVTEYVEAVREALADLPPSERDDLLEDLPAHLTEVAAEDPSPLVDRLGPATAYAAELRAAAAPAARPDRLSRRARLRARGRQVRAQLVRLDARVGPMLGYERVTDFGRLLRPAWWVLRGYLAAMLVVSLLDRQGSIGLLPRLGGSTLTGLVILVGFVAASIWLAQRTTDLRTWPRRALYLATAVLAFFAVFSLADIDANQRWGWPGSSVYVHDAPEPYYNPYEGISDVFVLDEHGRLLTNVRLIDQEGRPIDIGSWCDDYDEYDPWTDTYVIRYPRCWNEEDGLPWWAQARAVAPAPEPSPMPEPSPTPEPSATPGPDPTGAPSPEVTTSPGQ